MGVVLVATVLAVLCMVFPGNGTNSIATPSRPTSDTYGVEGCFIHNDIDGLFEPGTPHPRIIVTGGAGFIGGHLAARLVGRLESGQLKIVDNLEYGDISNLQTSEGKWILDVAATLCRADLKNKTITYSVLRGADTVIHLADAGGNPGCLSEHHQGVLVKNAILDGNTISAAKENGVGLFLYVSAACTAAARQQKRMRASHVGGRSSILTDQASAYQQSKLLGEQQAELARSDAFRVGILRMHEVYGPGTYRMTMPEQHVSSMMTKALMSPGEDLGPTTESQHPRNLLYVNDAVNAILLALDRGLDTGPLVVGGEETLTGNLAEAISTMTQRSGLKVAPNPAIARRGKHQSDGGSNADLETAQTVLGWKPSTALEAGLEATLPSVAHQMQQTKTLVILIGQARGGEMPWKSLHKHLLAPLDAHLALMFTDVQQPTVLLEWAQYVWSVPEYEDWSVVYDDAVASSCPSRHANATWRALCSLKGALFMGGIPDCQSPVWNSAGVQTDAAPQVACYMAGALRLLANWSLGADPTGYSAGILLAMRWTIQQKIIEYELLSKYDWFILSRSDELYACEHPDVKGLDPAYAWLPEGEHYGGWSDRHVVASSPLFAKIINITTDLVCRPEVWLARTQEAESNHEGLNLEWLIKSMWDLWGIDGKEFARPMFTVKTPADPTSWSTGSDHPVLLEYGLLMKYHPEVTLTQAHCSNLEQSLHDIKSYIV